jgi:hypothetical protein
VGRICAAAAADDADAACGHQGPHFCEAFGRNFVKVPTLVVTWQTGIREGGERSFQVCELLDETQSFMRTVDAIYAEDLGVALQELREGMVQGYPAREFPFLVWSEGADGRAVMERMLDAKGEKQLIQVLEGFQEEQIDTAVEESTQLRAKTLFAVDALGDGIRRRNTQGTDTTGDEGTLCYLSCQLGSLPVYLIDVIFKSMRGKPNGIRTEGIGLNDARSCRKILTVNLPNQLGTGQAEFLEALLRRHATFHEKGSHSAVTADRMVRDFLEQIHRHESRRISSPLSDGWHQLDVWC